MALTHREGPPGLSRIDGVGCLLEPINSLYCKVGVVRGRIASFDLIFRSTFSSELGRNTPSYLFHPNLFPQHYIQLSTASYQFIRSPARERSSHFSHRWRTGEIRAELLFPGHLHLIHLAKRVRNQYEQAINASLEADLTVNPEPGNVAPPFDYPWSIPEPVTGPGFGAWLNLSSSLPTARIALLAWVI